MNEQDEDGKELKLTINQVIAVTDVCSPSNSVLTRIRAFKHDELDDSLIYLEVSPLRGSYSFQNISPKDADQTALAAMLDDDTVKVVAATGPAGSGKTFLTIAWAIDKIMAAGPKSDLKIVFTKPTVTVGNNDFFGAVPGDVNDKFGIFLESYENTLEKVAGRRERLQLLIDKEVISFKPIQFTRGCNWDNTILILDEAQNVSWHELKTVLSRLGTNSKAILIGDLRQRDVKYGNGLATFTSTVAFGSSDITAEVKLCRDYRGPISKLVGIAADEIELATKQ
jgi:predicted ribonuclease YlaK